MPSFAVFAINRHIAAFNERARRAGYARPQQRSRARADSQAPLDARVYFERAVSASPLPSPLVVALIRRGPVPGQTAEQAIRYASDVRDICFAAGIESVSADYVAAGTNLEVARAQLIAAKAEDGPEIDTTIPPSALEARQRRADAAAVYAARRTGPDPAPVADE